MLKPQKVGDLFARFDLRMMLEVRLEAELGTRLAQSLLIQLEQLPLKSSHAVTRLGSYSCRGAESLAIRLQFAQEEDQLRQTLLHEIAHFLDHQTQSKPGVYRNPHSQSWRNWLIKIGGQRDSGDSDIMRELYRKRLKPIARCKRCGALLKRLRRLPVGRRWLHADCGGLLIALDETS